MPRSADNASFPAESRGLFPRAILARHARLVNARAADREADPAVVDRELVDAERGQPRIAGEFFLDQVEGAVLREHFGEDAPQRDLVAKVEPLADQLDRA